MSFESFLVESTW